MSEHAQEKFNFFFFQIFLGQLRCNLKYWHKLRQIGSLIEQIVFAQWSKVVKFSHILFVF